MKKQKIVIELPELSEEAAASLQNFINALMYAVDEQYYKQIHHHYKRQLDELMVRAQPTAEELNDPPF
jgi:hypothetical protein